MEDRNLSEVAQNPFAALFPSVEKAEKYRKQHGDAVTTLQTVDQHNADTVMQTQPLSVLLKDVQGIDSKNETEHGVVETLNNEKDRAWLVNDLLQRVFLITVDNDSGRVGNRQYGGLPKRCVYLRNTASDGEVPILQWINIDEAIMERLSMSHPRSHVMITGGARMTSLTAEIEAGEVANIKYLVSCYRRAFEECTKWKEKDANLFEMASRAKTLALSYAGTCLLSPEMFSKADPHKQLFQLLLNIQGDRVLAEFMDGIVQEHHERKDDLNSLFSPVLSMLAERAKDISSLLQSDLHTYINVLHLFAQHTGLAEILVSSKFWLPSKPPIGNIPGHAFEKQTLLGYFLGLTSMSKDPSKPSQFFQRPTEPSQGEIQATMSNLRRHLDDLSDKLHKVIIEIMKRSSLTKHQVLYWIGACLHGNIIRKKMVSQMFEFLATSQAEDGFFLNLSTLLLKMCQPFMDPCSPKLLKINPKYCAVSVSSEAIGKENTGLHLVGLDSETRLVIPPEEEHITLKVTPAFGFVTECFFMTHHCLHIGLWTVCEKYRKLMNELARLQQMYQEEGMLNERRKVQFENSIIKQLSLKTHLLNPSLIELALRFYIASASWLNQVALAGDDFEEMTCFKEVEIPLPTQTPTGLLFIPEYVVETMADFIIFLRHFSEDTLESAGRSLHHLVTFFVIYMGSPERVRNPHLRAKLAETLEALVPIQKSQNSSGLLSATSINMFNRQNAFLQHKFAPAYLPQALLQLFVDIEFTGHAMQFEQKFGYRHHMYSVLQYMWKQDNYKDTLFKLADEAANIQKNSITVQIPIFLRFLNLLINDSIYLLDEALQFMATLKKLQAEKDSGEWESLNEQAQQQKEQELQHTGGMARSHNILANETVRALSYMTAEIKRPFLIGCILRRIADMLNYFLLRLVGPKMGELKVKNLSEFHFKPQQLVSDIVDIYLDLGEDESFCHAVATDKRSYSPNLFKQSERVLKLIGRPSSVIFRLSELAHRVEECAQQEEEAEDLPEPPDEFVDPITSTLMTDPVILPTSNNVVDMSTICRHLLSDQKDPFNRSPLTLEMVQKHVELRERIQQWLAEVKAQKKS